MPFVDYILAVTHSRCGDQEKVVYHMRRALLGGVQLNVRTSPELKPFLDDPYLEEALSLSQ